MGRYRDSLAAYRDAGKAASAGDVAATEAAIARTDDLEFAHMQKVGECGGLEGRLAESTSVLRGAGIELLRLEKELAACVDVACVVEAGTRGEQLAREAVEAVDEVLAGLPDDEPVPPCLPRALKEMRRAFGAMKSAMQAVHELDVAPPSASRCGPLS